MKKSLLFATFFLSCFTMIGSAGLSWNCLEGQGGADSGGNCAPGRVAFTGSGLTASVHVNVSRTSTGQVIDDYDYDTAGGSIQFIETLVPADTYSIQVTGTNGVWIAKSITTGTASY